MWIGEERTDNGVTIWDYLQLSSLTLGRSKIRGFLQSPLHSIPCWSCWRSQSWDYHTKSPTPFCGSCYGLLFWEPEAWSSVCTERWFFLFWPDSPLVKKAFNKASGSHYLCTVLWLWKAGCTRYHSVQFVCDGWWLRLAIRILSCSLDHSGAHQTWPSSPLANYTI